MSELIIVATWHSFQLGLMCSTFLFRPIHNFTEWKAKASLKAPRKIASQQKCDNWAFTASEQKLSLQIH